MEEKEEGKKKSPPGVKESKVERMKEKVYIWMTYVIKEIVKES